MSFLRIVAFVWVVCCVGCSFDKEKMTAESDVTVQANDSKEIRSAPATREDLDRYLADFGKGQSWSYGEREAGELAGTWVSDDGDEHKLIFEADGDAGAFSETFNDGMTQGFYAVSAQGKIVAFSKRGGVGVGSHFQFDGKNITGPKGPSPSVTWTRIEEN